MHAYLLVFPESIFIKTISLLHQAGTMVFLLIT